MTTITRTESEVIARIKGIGEYDDFFGKRFEVLTLALPFDAAYIEGLLSPGLTDVERRDTERTWPGPGRVFEQAREYLDFAVEKIAGERGLSASRSVDAFREYIWLLTDDATEATYLTFDYEPYGQPQIEYAAEKLSLLDDFNTATRRHGLHTEEA